MEQNRQSKKEEAGRPTDDCAGYSVLSSAVGDRPRKADDKRDGSR